MNGPPPSEAAPQAGARAGAETGGARRDDRKAPRHPEVTQLRVRYGECDPQGIVFNANYLLYFDVAFTELWRDRIGAWEEMVEQGVDAVVSEANVRFFAPGRFDDELALHADVIEMDETSTLTELEVVRDGSVLVRGALRHVFISREDFKRTQIPGWIREGLKSAP